MINHNDSGQAIRLTPNCFHDRIYAKKLLHFIICFRQSDYQRIKLKFRNEAPPMEEKALSSTEKLHSICIQTPIHLHRKVKLNR